VKRVSALLLFVVGYSAIALLGPAAAAVPALAVFFAGGLQLSR
jgi:hypothetical protein